MTAGICSGYMLEWRDNWNPAGMVPRNTVLAVLFLVVLCTPHIADADGAPSALLRCRGVLHFGDGLSRAATVLVDLDRAQVSTPDCRKYPHLDGYCGGILLDIAEHSFQFGGAVSPENAKFWADLYRYSAVLPATAAGPAIEAMRVLFLGRCEPVAARRAVHLK
jgi:hypothetical protein